MKHSWHFDESQFSTTLMLQKPEEGGLFQYTKPIRGICGDKRESKIQVKIVDIVVDDVKESVLERQFRFYISFIAFSSLKLQVTKISLKLSLFQKI